MADPSAVDSNFERTFADLAFARMQDKAPTLLDYIIGFQLLDKNEDETHAVGVFGFKVGEEWIYCPVFFINGELKGHELMYIKSQDAFVPLTEEWVNYTLNRKPQVLGKMEPTPRGQLGLRQPDFNLFARPPYVGSKYAAAPRTFNEICNSIGPGFKAFMEVFRVGSNHEKFASLKTRFDLRYALRQLGKEAAATLVRSMRRDEKFADAVLRYYDIRDLLDFKKAAGKLTQQEAGYTTKAASSNCSGCKHYSGERSCETTAGDVSPQGSCNYYSMGNDIKPIEPVKEAAAGDVKIEGTAPKVVVVLRGDDNSAVMAGMTEADKRKLMREGYVVHDPRKPDNRSRLYKTKINQTFSSPGEDGYYEVATANGARRKVLVSMAPINVGYAGDWEQGKCMVTDPETKQFGLFYTQDIMTTKKLSNDEWRELFKGLPNQDSLGIDSEGVFITPHGNTTVPFRVNKKWTNPEGQTELEVSSSYMQTRGSSMFRHRAYGSRPIDEIPGGTTIKFILLTGKPGTKITSVGETLFVPADCKAVKMSREFKNTMGGTMDLGTMPEVALRLYKEASAAEDVFKFQLKTDGIRYQACLDDKQGQHMSKLAVVRSLVLDYGLSEDDALHLIKTAEPRKGTTYWIKIAKPSVEPYNTQPYRADFNAAEPIQGEEFGVRAPVMYPVQSIQNLGSPDAGNNREFYRETSGYIDDAARQFAGTAAEQGQKEVMDTSVISGLVKTLDIDDKVDSYVPDLLLGLDRIGRILFELYWFGDKFKERYGSQDLSSLEEILRSTFKQVGELCLWLKSKSVRSEAPRHAAVSLSSVGP